MRGRLEHKIRMENNIQKRIEDMPDYIKRFYFSLNQKSHTTKNIYINNVIRFIKHKYGEEFPSVNEFEKIDSYDIQVYISEIQYYNSHDGIKALKETTQATIYSSLAAFFVFLCRSCGITNNPFLNGMIERPTIQENAVVYLTPDEVKSVENSILNGVGNARSIGKQRKWKYRDILLFRIPVVNGLRVTALSEINVEDIDLINKRILVTEKRNVTKTVDIDDKTMDYITTWLKDRKELLGDAASEERSLFISNRRKRMTVRSIELIIQKYTECIEGKHITPHKLRSTCGTNTYQATKDIYLVSKVLGHKNTMPTKRYAAVFNEDITDAVNKVAKLY